MAGLDSGIMQPGLKAARRLFPEFDPIGVRFKADFNSFNRTVYRDGSSVSGRLSEVAQGVVDQRIIATTMTIGGASHVFVVLIKVQDKVVGALSFQSTRPLNEAERHAGESLAQRAAVALQASLA